MIRSRSKFILACALLAAGICVPPAIADPGRVTGLTAISGTTPFPGGCGVPGTPTLDSEAEPSIAVNPGNPDNIVATYQQDRFAVFGGALSDLVATSHDGGRTWERVKVPGASACTGGQDERTSDPWVSIGPDGTTYLGILTFNDVRPLSTLDLAGPTQARASRSLDGGRSFEPPVAVAADGTYNDREMVTADPTRPGTAYFAWVKRLGVLGESGVSMFSRTTDGGKNWTTQRLTRLTPPLTVPDPILIEVLPDGSLLNFFLLANLSPFLPEGAPIVPWQVMVMRSMDRGNTWSRPVRIGKIGNPFPPEDPDTGAQVRAYPEISADVAADGTAYVVWNEILSHKRSRILFARSSDRGKTWTAPAPVAEPRTQAFIPSLAVARGGTVGVTWDDFRGDQPDDGKLTTEVRFAHSHDGGRTWHPTRLAGPFDVLTAAKTSTTEIAGHFVGDYQGLAARRRGFVAAFAVAKPIDRRSSGLPRIRGPSDILFARIHLGRAAGR